MGHQEIKLPPQNPDAEKWTSLTNAGWRVLIVKPAIVKSGAGLCAVEAALGHQDARTAPNASPPKAQATQTRFVALRTAEGVPVFAYDHGRRRP